MSTPSSKSNILNKIRTALEQPTPIPFSDSSEEKSFFQPLKQDIIVEFAEQFTQLGGKFLFCVNEEELRDNFEKLCYQNQWTKIYCSEDKLHKAFQQSKWHENISTCEASITSCEQLVARTGSMVLSSAANGRIPSVYAPIHICVAYTSQLVYDIEDALLSLVKAYSNAMPSVISFATGPSRTADIEKTLVVGVHGPKEVYCFLVDDFTEEI